jgi:ubiquinol-cytochrome c reductase cytochrome b subunit
MTVALAVALFGWLTYSSRQPHLVPDFSVEPLPAEVVGVDSGPIAEGAQLFYDKACLYCHDIAGYGGRLGPDLTYVGDRLHPLRMQEIIFVGARNMPSYLDALTVEEMEHLMAFLESRRRGE